MIMVDACFEGAVAAHHWHLCKGRKYYRRWIYPGAGVQLGEMLHDFVFRLAHGSSPQPPLSVDHIDGNTRNNTASNLRPATQRLQGLNQRSRTDRGLPRGVTRKSDRYRSRPYAAKIADQGRRKHLGYFATPEEAAAVYASALADEIAKEEAKSWELFRNQKEGDR